MKQGYSEHTAHYTLPNTQETTMPALMRIISNNGKKKAVWLDMYEETVEFRNTSPKPVFRPGTYQYNNAGIYYQLACDLFWEMKDAQ